MSHGAEESSTTDQQLLEQRTFYHPMNQEEFDTKFQYCRTEQKPILRHVAKFLKNYYRPCLSFKYFISTLISFVPILNWLPKYNFREDLLADAIGGITTGVMHVPQGIAYAVVSGVHPIIGLYTSFFPALFYMVLGTSKHCSIGSFAVVAVMTSVAVSKIQAEYGDISTAVEFNNTNAQNAPYVPSAESITTVLTLCSGLFQIIMGILHLEIIITYFSDQVVDGFTTAASFYVLATQLREFFGLPNLPRRTGAGNLFLRFYDVAVSMVNINWATTVISITSVAFLIIGKDHITPYIKRKTKIPIAIPFELILIIIVTIISSLFKFNSNMSVKIVNKLPIGMPSPHVLDISLISKAFPNAIAISIVVFAVHISMAKMLAKKFKYQIDSSQEFYAVGLSSVLSSVFPVYPVTSAVGRTMVNVNAGSKTQFSTIFSSILLAAIILYIGQWLSALPMGVLSAIIIVAIKGMLEKFKDLQNLWPVSKIDFSIWLVSFLATFCWDVTEGLAVSIVFAIMTTVFRTQWPKWHLLANLSGINEYRDERRYQNVIRNKGIYIFHFDSPLVFTNVEYFKTCIYKALEKLQDECSDHDKNVDVIENMKQKDPNIELAKETSLEDNESEKLKNNFKLNENLQYFIFDCSGITYVDYMGINAIKEMFIELKTKNIIVYFAGIKDHVRDIFETSNSYKIIPKSSFFPTIQDAVATAKASQHVQGFKPKAEPSQATEQSIKLEGQIDKL